MPENTSRESPESQGKLQGTGVRKELLVGVLGLAIILLMLSPLILFALGWASAWR